MKPILTSILALILATSLHAQHFQVGFNGGAVISRAPLVFEEYHSNQHMFMAGTISAQYDSHLWQYGFSVGYRANSFSDSYYEHILGGCFPPYIQEHWAWVTTHGSLREIPLRLFINRKITFKRFETYIGPFLGYSATSDKYDVLESGVHHAYIYRHNWLACGIQAGSTYFITKRLGINAGIATEYNILLGSGLYSRHSYPITLGLRYKL